MQKRLSFLSSSRGEDLKVRLTSVSAVMLMAILAVLVGSALADNTSPPAQTAPTVTADPSDSPAPPAVVLPVTPAPAPAANLPVVDTQIQAMLIKQVRVKIVLYRKSVWHWQNLLGLKMSPGGNIWALGSLKAASKVMADWKVRSYQLHLAAKRMMRKRIQQFRSIVGHWRLVAGIRPAIRTLASSRNGLEEEFARWHQAEQSVLRQAAHPPYESQLQCIHFNPRVGHGEGAWNANTGNGYYGGLQMDWGFMSSYGDYLLRTKGTADHWTPLEQIWVAVKAIKSGRGFTPWPNTAADCGLL